MANTRDTLGDQVTLDGLVSHTLETFEDDGVTSLRNRAFYKNSGLKRVKLPNLASVSTQAFQASGLTKIEEVDLPNVESVRAYGISECADLTEINLPKCKETSNYAFYDSQKLTKVVLRSNDLISLVNNTVFQADYALRHLVLDCPQKVVYTAFTGQPFVRGEGAVYVPTSMLATYKADANWGKLIIEDIANYPLEKFETITDSWAEIVANQSYATDYAIGDTKAIKIGSLWYTAEIVGIDKDVGENGNTIPLTWMLIDLLADKHRMNATNTNANGWVQTEMRSYLINDILPNIDIKDLIVPAVKTFYDRTTESTLSCTDSIWIPSIREVMNGTVTDAIEDSGCIYDGKFTNNPSRDKYSRESSNSYYWLRSAKQTTNGFGCVSTGGGSSQSGCATTHGVLLGFCTN